MLKCLNATLTQDDSASRMFQFECEIVRATSVKPRFKNIDLAIGGQQTNSFCEHVCSDPAGPEQLKLQGLSTTFVLLL